MTVLPLALEALRQVGDEVTAAGVELTGAELVLLDDDAAQAFELGVKGMEVNVP
jgi:hypothetical protein